MASLITGRINDILRILRDVTVTFASVVWEPVRLSGATDRNIKFEEPTVARLR
jgi:hypothetical protein